MAEVGDGLVLGVARALILAGRWELADELLADTQTSDPALRVRLALARALVAVELRQWRGVGDPAGALAAAAALVGGSADTYAAFELDLLRLFSDYWTELHPDNRLSACFGPAGRDRAVLDELQERAELLTSAAPDSRCEALAAFYAGLVCDNLRDEPEEAEARFLRALAACRPGADDDVASEALRHLGGLARAAGDQQLGRQQWERSAELAQRAGRLPLALAQQALLAELAADEGDIAGASMLARQVGRWAAALGLPRLESQSAAIYGASAH